jgi:hypothetical protein
MNCVPVWRIRSRLNFTLCQVQRSPQRNTVVRRNARSPTANLEEQLRSLSLDLRSKRFLFSRLPANHVPFQPQDLLHLRKGLASFEELTFIAAAGIWAESLAFCDEQKLDMESILCRLNLGREVDKGKLNIDLDYLAHNYRTAVLAMRNGFYRSKS